MPLQSQILIGHEAATSLLRAVNDKNGLGRDSGPANDDRVVTLLGDARHQSKNHAGISLVDIGTDKRDALAPRVVVLPDVDLVKLRPSEGPPRIICMPLPGPSRAERRRQYQASHSHLPAPPHHLGTFEGERMRNSHGYTDPYSLRKALASLAAVAAMLFCASLILGAI